MNKTVPGIHRPSSTLSTDNNNQFQFKPMYLLKKTIMSSCSGVRLALKRDSTSPFTENTHYAGVEVAVKDKYSLTQSCYFRKSILFSSPSVKGR